MDRFIYYDLLFDIYKELLSNNNKEYFKLYYEENLTLQEIADIKQVSKSYVGNMIKKTTKRLDELEDKLHIYKRQCKLKNILKENDINKIKEDIKEILK